MAAPQSHANPSQPPQLDFDPVTVDGAKRCRRRHGQRSRHSPTSALDDIQRGAPGAGHRQVAAHDDRGLLFGDRLDRGSEPVGVVERYVRDDGHSAVPGVRGVEPAAQPNLDNREIHAHLGEPQERDGRQQLEFGRVAVPAGHGFGLGQHPPGKTRERLAVNRHSADLQPLAVGHEMRLGRLADLVSGRGEGRPNEGQHAALAIRAGNQGAAEGTFGVIESGEQGLRSTKSEANAESTAGCERVERLGVAEPVGRQSFVRSSS